MLMTEASARAIRSSYRRSVASATASPPAARAAISTASSDRPLVRSWSRERPGPDR